MDGSITRRTMIAGIAAGGVALRAQAAGGGTVPIATTLQGRVRGFTRRGASVFLGLPYGGDTGGARRFRPPAPPAAWSGLRDATRFGPRAPQPAGHLYDSPLVGPFLTGGRQAELIAMGEPEGEDCLVLNVLTPAVDRARRPVMVYFHGGAYASGSGAIMTLADGLVTEQDVVLVTVNHRLGPLGFLWMGGLSDEYAHGNPGMLDCVAALAWVRGNIANFGGDPARVTIFGESGGAAKVAMLCAMPEAAGLFHGAIMQSGLVPEPVDPAAADGATRAAARALGDGDPLMLLRSAGAADLVRVVGTAGPVADGLTLSADPWRIAPAAAAAVPAIVGFCTDEATLFYGMPDPATFALGWDALPGKLARDLPVDRARIATLVAGYRAALPRAGASDLYFRIMSDATFVRGMLAIADAKARQPAPVFLYRMDYDTRIAPGLRAFHTAELPLVGRLVDQPRAEPLSRRLAAAWAAFARTGRPGLADWQPHRPGGDALMTFDVAGGFGPDPTASPRAALYAALGGAAVPYAPGVR